MCFIHVLLNAKDWNVRDHEVKIVVEGTATKLIPELAKPENIMHKLWENAKQSGIVSGACRACSSKLGVLNAVTSQNVDLIEGIAGHPSMAKYQEDGFEMISF